MEHVRGDVDSRTLNLVGPTSIEPDAGDDGANITPGHCDRLAIVQRLDGSKKLQVLLEEIGQLVQQPATVLRSNLLPGPLKGCPGSSDGNIYILLCGLVHRTDNLLGGRVNDLKRLLIDTLDEFVVDKAVRGNLG